MVQGDHGLLFCYALTVLIFSVILVFTAKNELLAVARRLLSNRSH